MGKRLDGLTAKYPWLQYAGEAFIWLVLVILFTYYPLLNAIFKQSLDFATEYVKNQKTIAAFVANLAVLGLIGYDHYKSSSASYITKKMLVIEIFCLISIFLIRRFTVLYATNEIQDYFNAKTLWPSYITHIIYLVLLFTIKYNTSQNYNTHKPNNITKL